MEAGIAKTEDEEISGLWCFKLGGASTSNKAMWYTYFNI